MSTRVMLADNKKVTDAILEKHLAECGFLWMQPKIDGMRTFISSEAVPQTRSGKEWKHRPLRAFAQALPSLRGKDGEVVPGHYFNANAFRDAMSSIRAEDGTREFTYYLFDDVTMDEYAYLHRFDAIKGWISKHGEYHEGDGYHARVLLTETSRVKTLAEIRELEENHIIEGWEGSMLRRPDRPYKFGRSTNLGGHLIKLKGYEDAEAVVIGYQPWYENHNTATQSPLGYQVRSSHAEGKVPIERLGALEVHLLTDPSVTFKIGVMRGITHADRDRLWQERDSLIGRICKFKHQGYGGGYDAPRTPVFLNWRSPTEF